MFWNKKKSPLHTSSTDFYKKPEDVKRLEREAPIGSVQFSIALLKARYPNMDIITQIRADKTLYALKTGGVYGDGQNRMG